MNFLDLYSLHQLYEVLSISVLIAPTFVTTQRIRRFLVAHATNCSNIYQKKTRRHQGRPTTTPSPARPSEEEPFGHVYSNHTLAHIRHGIIEQLKKCTLTTDKGFCICAKLNCHCRSNISTKLQGSKSSNQKHHIYMYTYILNYDVCLFTLAAYLNECY